eukprot:TRINITY_DN1566_c0_g1_i1.p1 TRINITY_DN1566_c0_g1~~TRINITY_DN1566_c0_g1_i1.p1  ORF type:complete len:1465 (-),score=343.02 TRINITY_DN1566_c0_g1_i1:4419-8813(-)
MYMLPMESFRYWGKAQPDSASHHLLQFHCLDVTAVLTELLCADEILRKRMEGLARCSLGEILPVLQFFTAIHDIGKFSAGFQWKREDIAKQFGHPPPLRAGDPMHHTKAGWWFYRNRIMSRNAELPQLVAWRVYRRMLAPIAMAAIGHHGAPVDDRGVNNRDFFYSNEAALGHAAAMAELFLPQQPPDFMEDEDWFRPLSWLFAGLMVAADWIGSSEEYFPYRAEPMDVHDYFAETREQAREAVRKCGLLHPAAAQGHDFDSLLPQLKGHSPRPLQRYAMDDAVVDGGPQLHIFEDLTGCGKTEAALLCAHKIMGQGGCSGFYVGLPTMATANAMYHRLAATYRALFDYDGETPSLMLAHGQRNIEDAFLQTIALEQDAAPRMGEVKDVTCSQWLADNRKKALLAPCGAGTLDQALLSVLPARHQSLRLAGLSRTVLIADEVHSYDLYTGELLATLLTFIAAMGSSAILLTATLPQSLRLKLVQAFQRGLGSELSQSLEEDAFPLATRVDGAGAVAEAPIPVEGNGKTTAVELVHDEQAMVGALVEASRVGACACWIRNTVDQAIDTARRLVDEYGLPSDKVILCHARFAMCDRLERETEILRRFGKNSTPEDRAGYVLVGSQVLEQSLDYDVDLMLSDLAPMDALIQRAGRCHRHERKRPEGYGKSRLVVLSPEPVDDPAADWYGAVLGKARFVYRKQVLLWRTALLLRDKGCFTLPADARELMEGAYGEEIEAPAVLEEADLQPMGDELAARSLAYQNALSLDSGYTTDSGAGWSDDTAAATRIGDERVQLRLCRVGEDGRVTLWAGGAGAKACALSEVSVSTKRMDKPDADPDSAALKEFAETMPDKGRWVRLVALRETDDGEWAGQVPRDGRLVAVRYSRAKGLQTEQQFFQWFVSVVTFIVDPSLDFWAIGCFKSVPANAYGIGQLRPKKQEARMSLNLVRDRWLPAVLKSGRVERIAPWEITRADDPPIGLAPPRHDFRLALFEFLIGLVQTACPPANTTKREQWYDAPPSPDTLRGAMEPYARFFELLGERPLFQQDLTLDPKEHAKSAISIGALLINYPGDGSLELFVKRDIEFMCPICAAMALQTMQAFAPSGGRGNRTSLRGGGPLSTIVMGENLWRIVWPNVLSLDARDVKAAPTAEELPGNVFPWAAPTRTSENGEVFRLADGHFLHHYWGMPRRFLLLPEEKHCRCELCGDESETAIRQLIQRPYGYNYGEDWKHPLTPYNRTKADQHPFPIHGKPYATAYTNWLPLVYGGSNGLAEPARCVQVAREDDPDIANEYGLLAGGYDMDNMKARGWCEGSFPIMPLDGEDVQDFRTEVETLVKAASMVRDNLTKAIRTAVVHTSNPARSKAFGSSFFADLSASFWADTRAAFFVAAEELAEVVKAEAADAKVKQAWARALRDEADALFMRVAGPEMTHPDHARRASKAFNEMRKLNQGVYKRHLGGTITTKEAA